MSGDGEGERRVRTHVGWSAVKVVAGLFGAIVAQAGSGQARDGER